MSQAVYGIARDRAQAERIVAALGRAGFAAADIARLPADDSGAHSFAHAQHTKAAEGALVGAGLIGLGGGVLGWLAGVGVLAISRMGPLIAAGPILAALSGLAVGALVGVVLGALLGLRWPVYEARLYQGKIRSSNILIAVHAGGRARAARARAVFERALAENIASSGEASAHF